MHPQGPLVPTLAAPCERFANAVPRCVNRSNPGRCFPIIFPVFEAPAREKGLENKDNKAAT
jgi:hypothetical protein